MAEPVNANGVLMGMVKLPPDETTGVAFVIVVVTGQVFVARFACICAIEAW